jgi:hypothetical protein
MVLHLECWKRGFAPGSQMRFGVFVCVEAALEISIRAIVEAMTPAARTTSLMVHIVTIVIEDMRRRKKMV